MERYAIGMESETPKNMSYEGKNYELAFIFGDLKEAEGFRKHGTIFKVRTDTTGKIKEILEKVK